MKRSKRTETRGLCFFFFFGGGGRGHTYRPTYVCIHARTFWTLLVATSEYGSAQHTYRLCYSKLCIPVYTHLFLANRLIRFSLAVIIARRAPCSCEEAGVHSERCRFLCRKRFRGCSVKGLHAWMQLSAQN